MLSTPVNTVWSSSTSAIASPKTAYMALLAALNILWNISLKCGAPSGLNCQLIP